MRLGALLTLAGLAVLVHTTVAVIQREGAVPARMGAQVPARPARWLPPTPPPGVCAACLPDLLLRCALCACATDGEPADRQLLKLSQEEFVALPASIVLELSIATAVALLGGLGGQPAGWHSTVDGDEGGQGACLCEGENLGMSHRAGLCVAATLVRTIRVRTLRVRTLRTLPAYACVRLHASMLLLSQQVATCWLGQSRSFPCRPRAGGAFCCMHAYGWPRGGFFPGALLCSCARAPEG